MGEDKELLLRDMLLKRLGSNVAIRSRSGTVYTGALTEVHSTFIIVADGLLMIDAIESMVWPKAGQREDDDE